LLRRLERGPRPSPEVAQAWQRLVASAGAVPIGRIASGVGWSHKHLIARFRQQVGLTPKTAARLVRLEGVWRGLEQRWPLDWGQLARDAGYADQAHLTATSTSSPASHRPSSWDGCPPHGRPGAAGDA
jgi:methylphosphotriester-DNA--protein-cysteine methyltransferase